MARPVSLLDTVEDPGDSPDKSDVSIFGAMGSGKTSLLRTKKGRGLVLYTPGKEGTAGKMVLKKWRKRIKVATITEFAQYKAWLLALRDEMPKRPQSEQYDWVAFDTLTGGLELKKTEVLAKRPPSARKGRVKITGTEWGQIADGLDSDLIQPYKALPISTIWLCHEKDRRGKRKHGKLGPDLTPGALSNIAAPSLFVGRLSMMHDDEGNKEQWMRIGAHDTMATKYRAADWDLEVPDIIKEPHIDKLIEFLYADAGTVCPFAEAFEVETEEEEDDLEDLEEVEPTKKRRAAEPNENDADDEEDEEDE